MQRQSDPDRLALIDRTLADMRQMLDAMPRSPALTALLERHEALGARVRDWRQTTPSNRAMADLLADVLELNMAASKLRRDVSG